MAVAATCALTSACRKHRPPAPKASASASVGSARVPSAEAGPTAELKQLIELSKSTLSREEKRARLTAVLEKFPANHRREREDLIVQAVARGALDPPEWTIVTSNYKGRRAQIQVTTDALTILGVRFDVTAEGAQRIADQLHAILLGRNSRSISTISSRLSTSRVSPLLASNSANFLRNSASSRLTG